MIAKQAIGAGKSAFGSVIAALEAEDRAAGRSPEFSAAAFEAGALVRRMRRAARLTQAALAERIGVTQARISEIETGIGPQGPSWELFLRITAACGAELLVRLPGETAGAHRPGGHRTEAISA